MRIGVTNLATIITGDWRAGIADGDTILTDGGLIEKVGDVTSDELDRCDVVIDAGGATAIPGLIDSQVHITFGDFTPRQNTVGFLASYLHGGTTTSISASEVHVPGRPKDPQGVKALAVAAHKCFKDYRPGGMLVHGGSIILEPGLTAEDFAEIHADGVWLAKAGFGAVGSASEYIDLVRMARDTEIAMQVCTAGNLRTTILCAEMARKHDAFDRFLIATDTPTGTGVMPLGMIYTMIQIASLTDFDPIEMIAAATGNVAKIYGLNSGFLRAGCDADLVIIDAPLGGTQGTALEAMKNGDPFSIGAVISDGVPRFVGRSRNTPPTTRKIAVARSNVITTFA
jgi:enamidase